MSTEEYKERISNLIMGMAIYFLLDEETSEKIALLRMRAAFSLIPIIRHYIETGEMEGIIDPIYLRKLAYISASETKKDMDEITKPPKPRYNGSKAVCEGPFYIPQEELILWSQTSLMAPLNQAGFDRYMEVFKAVFGYSIEELEKAPCLSNNDTDAA